MVYLIAGAAVFAVGSLFGAFLVVAGQAAQRAQKEKAHDRES